MSNETLTSRRPRVIFFGMLSNFSSPSLSSLLESGVDLCAVILPVSEIPGNQTPAIQRRELPRINRLPLPIINATLQSSIMQFAWLRQIPVWEVNNLSDARTVSTLASYQPDFICVACFSRRIPRSIIDLPLLACLNVHPSLLPANRGPEPLFWTFHEGCEKAGVTIHFMNEGMDSGDILMQEVIDVPDGITYAQLEAHCAMRGGTMLARSVWDLYRGPVKRIQQDDTSSSYHAFPTEQDFVVQVEEWTAQRIYKFISGVGRWDRPIELRVGDKHMFVKDVISYSHNDINNGNILVCSENEGYLKIRCKDGWVIVRPEKW